MVLAQFVSLYTVMVMVAAAERASTNARKTKVRMMIYQEESVRIQTIILF
jgi:hypothetical protein